MGTELSLPLSRGGNQLSPASGPWATASQSLPFLSYLQLSFPSFVNW
ncbi:unnamed protein product [Gulo gulo]|uniref:Uncharacterized protein n=1 Tax=Gulo gulo TaxID=48420 RepID=A0A9X9LJ04_GULGU|nr:unnamed protein product [Gulo gulo]